MSQMALLPHGTDYKMDATPSCAMEYLTLPLDLWIHATNTMTVSISLQPSMPRVLITDSPTFRRNTLTLGTSNLDVRGWGFLTKLCIFYFV